jgi:hypothetical protein
MEISKEDERREMSQIERKKVVRRSKRSQYSVTAQRAAYKAALRRGRTLRAFSTCTDANVEAAL